MAVQSTKSPSSVRIYLDKGFDVNQNSIIASKTLNNIHPTATDQAIFDVVNALVALQKHELHNVVRIDNTVLSDQ